MASFRTLTAEFRHESDKVKGSRFLALLTPATDEDRCDAFVASARKLYHDARHHCFAWRLGRTGDRFRYSDDGEPAGSAGKPILQAIDGHGVTDLCVVVVRWFGGTKLGVGGLVRAYGGCVAEALELAPIATVRVVERATIRYGYELSGAVQSVLASAEDIVVVASSYGEYVELIVDVPIEHMAAFTIALRDRTADRVRLA